MTLNDWHRGFAATHWHATLTATFLTAILSGELQGICEDSVCTEMGSGPLGRLLRAGEDRRGSPCAESCEVGEWD